MRSDARTTRVAFILCGGAGTRLRGITDRPKGLVDVAGWPFLAYVVSAARSAAVDSIVFLTGYRGEEIEAAFGPPSPTRAFVREDRPLGTAGALRSARSLRGETNLVLNGDSYVGCALGEFVATAPPDAAALLAVRLEDSTDYGALEIDSEGRVRGFAEKATAGGGWINAGVYAIPARMLDELPEGKASLEREIFPRWAADGRLVAYRAEAFFRDIGTPERLRAAQAEFAPIRRRLDAEGGRPR